MSNAFSALGIASELAEVLRHNGINDPTPVQSQTIPLLLQERDVIAQAQTGTGKTLAFALPMLQRINTDKEQVQALILTPTRELAIQITAEIKKLAPTVGATVLAAYGGQDVDAQIRKLQRAPHIVVATPGRLIDHMTRGTISLGKLSMLVLDEADQMLHMGFLPEVESIIMQTPKARQTMLFSATMPEAIRRLAGEYMKSPADVTIRSVNVTLDNISQLVVATTDRGKQQALIHLLEQHQPYLAVIFCRTKVRAKKLNEALQDHGFESDELHGDLTQAKREQVMKRFREARLQMLVATDVAARGLDVEGVTHVYNYDMPLDAENYIHRIGRTGRAGQTGMAVTLATPYDSAKLAAVEKGIQAQLDRRSIDRDGVLGSEGAARRSPRANARDSKDAGSPQSRGGGRRGGAHGADTGRRGGARSAAAETPGRRGRAGAGNAERGGDASATRAAAGGRSTGKRGQADAMEPSASASGNPWEAAVRDSYSSGRNQRRDNQRGAASSRGGRDAVVRGRRDAASTRGGGAAGRGDRDTATSRGRNAEGYRGGDAAARGGRNAAGPRSGGQSKPGGRGSSRTGGRGRR